MAYSISDDCINCGACEDTCPLAAISQEGEKFVINADECTSCGACLDSCPVEAIIPG